MKSVLFLFSILIISSGFDSIRFYEPKPGTSSAINKNLVLELVNRARTNGCKCGDTYYYPVPALKWNSILEKAAFHHSVDMEQKKYFSHIAPDGSKAGKRIEKVGYKWKAYGENIASGYSTEAAVVEGWLKSPGHCKNIMNKMYKEMGMGRSGRYWTQNFGAK
ncbi:MAG: CAP domain-containing protein [Flavisolibacter sp.]|nr:CAP domain-containing protein [Flavisolibacter sp.]